MKIVQDPVIGILFDWNIQQIFVKFRVEIPSAPNIEENIEGLYQNQPTNTGGLIYNQHVIYTFDLFKGDIKTMMMMMMMEKVHFL